jgi:hypothetical protein
VILAIDPGTSESGFCFFVDGKVQRSGVADNAEIIDMVDDWPFEIAIEMIASYGMAVGREVFETCVWIGRFVQASRDPAAVRMIYRRDVKLHLCGSPQAKDPNIRQALLDMFPRTGGGKTPQVGTKKEPGPLYGVASHAWSALAVAVTATQRGAM